MADRNGDLMKISAVVFTKNEESNITDCINSLANFSEIVVVDSNSEDLTTVIAGELGAKVINFKWSGSYPKKRQWVVENIKFENEWILFVDADERVPQNLECELESRFNELNSNYSAGIITLRYKFNGKLLKFGQKPRKVSLLRIGRVSWPTITDLDIQGMGELEGHYQPSILGKTARIKSQMIHDDRDPYISWVRRHIRYAEWEASIRLREEANSIVNSHKIPGAKLFHSLPAKGLFFFTFSYFVKFGFLDGKSGFDYAISKSWYYWLIGVLEKEARK
jgi:glycosyltransferase involved in cell wall biosynthesis